VANHNYAYSDKLDDRMKHVGSERRMSSSPSGSRRAVTEIGDRSKTGTISVQVDAKHGAYFSFPSIEEFEGYSDKEMEEKREKATVRYSKR